MQESIIWIILGIAGIIVTFLIFGIELPLYLSLTVVGLFVYAYSDNPLYKFIGGWIGRICAILFFISLFYYIGTRSLFPDNLFTFRFLKVGVQLTLEFLNIVSNFIGKLVLSLIDIIIP